jgi:hypothetical protein
MRFEKGKEFLKSVFQSVAEYILESVTFDNFQKNKWFSVKLDYDIVINSANRQLAKYLLLVPKTAIDEGNLLF